LLDYEFSIEGIHPCAKITNGEARSARPIDDVMTGDIPMNFGVYQGYQALLYSVAGGHQTQWIWDGR
jgi:hypothetical protein